MNDTLTTCKPSPAQKVAFKRSLARGGDRNLTGADMTLLASHPYLTRSQRRAYAALAAQQEATC